MSAGVAPGLTCRRITTPSTIPRAAATQESVTAVQPSPQANSRISLFTPIVTSVRMYENPDWLGGYPVGRLIDDIASTQGYPGIEYFWRGDYWIRFAGWQGSGGTTPTGKSCGSMAGDTPGGSDLPTPSWEPLLDYTCWPGDGDGSSCPVGRGGPVGCSPRAVRPHTCRCAFQCACGPGARADLPNGGVGRSGRRRFHRVGLGSRDGIVRFR
jgi:hypothetical protein